MIAYPARSYGEPCGQGSQFSRDSGNGDNTMRRICPLDGAAFPTDDGPAGGPSGWDHHVWWHVTEMDVEANMFGEIRPDALDVDAFLDRGAIRHYQPSE
jgi:hypothetical protein